jgi:hypothetical protein
MNRFSFSDYDGGYIASEDFDKLKQTIENEYPSETEDQKEQQFIKRIQFEESNPEKYIFDADVDYKDISQDEFEKTKLEVKDKMYNYKLDHLDKRAQDLDKKQKELERKMKETSSSTKSAPPASSRVLTKTQIIPVYREDLFNARFNRLYNWARTLFPLDLSYTERDELLLLLEEFIRKELKYNSPPVIENRIRELLDKKLNLKKKSTPKYTKTGIKSKQRSVKKPRKKKVMPARSRSRSASRKGKKSSHAKKRSKSRGQKKSRSKSKSRK